MAEACTVCGTVNVEGAPTCAGCRQPLALAAPGEARCSRHPEALATGTCPRCGTFACQRCLEPGLCPTCVAKLGGLPWDERASLGVLRAWWRTTFGMLRAPRLTLARAWPEASMGSSCGFAWLSTVVATGGWWLLHARPVAGAVALMRGAELPNGNQVAYLVGAAGGRLLSTLLPVLLVLLFARVDHWALGRVGARHRPFAVTVRAGALSLAPLVLAVTPCTVLLAAAWVIGLRGAALRSLHGVSRRQAQQAALPSLLLMLLLFAGAVVAALGVTPVPGQR